MVVVCSWMVMSRGDYIGVLGMLVGAPAILVTVFGIGYVLLSGSSFASTSTKRLPQAARLLLGRHPLSRVDQQVEEAQKDQAAATLR